MKSWIQSFSGQKIEPLALVPETIRIEDIAHALSNKCRFTGHVRHFYSVAQHCVEGSLRLPSAFQLAFLLHEVSEAYLPDVASPVKQFLWVERGGGGTARPWKELEADQATIIMGALGLSSLRPLIDSTEVGAMDLAMLVLEKNTLLGEPPEPWSGMPDSAVGNLLEMDHPDMVAEVKTDRAGGLTTYRLEVNQRGWFTGPLSPRVAEELFLARFKELTR